MRDYLLFLGVPPQNINIQTHLPKVDWEQYHRIDLLAKMRNEGMKPLYDTAPSGLTYDGKPWSAVIYYNDVYLSGTHFLELLHQHYMQDADMTCGWDHAGRWFYDGWVGRDMSGDLYTPFPVKEEDKDLPQKVSPFSSFHLSFFPLIPLFGFLGRLSLHYSLSRAMLTCSYS
jgi:alpha-1,3-mannosyltransferase